MILFDNFGACSFVVYFCLSLICFVLVSFIWISSKGDSHFRPIWPFAISPISCLSCIVIFWIFWCKCMFDFIWYWNKDWDWDWNKTKQNKTKQNKTKQNTQTNEKQKNKTKQFWLQTWTYLIMFIIASRCHMTSRPATALVVWIIWCKHGWNAIIWFEVTMLPIGWT